MITFRAFSFAVTTLIPAFWYRAPLDRAITSSDILVLRPVQSLEVVHERRGDALDALVRHELVQLVLQRLVLRAHALQARHHIQHHRRHVVGVDQVQKVQCSRHGRLRHVIEQASCFSKTDAHT